MTPKSQPKNPSAAADWTQRWQRHRGAVIAVFVALVAVAAIFAWRSHVRETADANGLRELYKVHRDVRRGATPAADRAAAYAKIAVDHADSDATVAQTLMFEFAAHREAENTAAAAQTARNFLVRFPRHALAPDMRLALVKILTTPGQADAAREEFAKLQRDLPQELAPDVALLRGQIEMAAAEAAAERPGDRQHYLEAARDAFQQCIDQARSHTWSGVYLTFAQLQLATVTDALAGHVPGAPVALSSTSQIELIPVPDADHVADLDHDGHDHARDSAPPAESAVPVPAPELAPAPAPAEESAAPLAAPGPKADEEPAAKPADGA